MDLDGLLVGALYPYSALGVAFDLRAAALAPLFCMADVIDGDDAALKVSGNLSPIGHERLHSGRVLVLAADRLIERVDDNQ